jgi:hypothetical protein
MLQWRSWFQPLRGLGLGQYEGTFRESEIEADVLPELTEADLEKLGLPLGPRKRILKAIANLGGADSPANSNCDIDDFRLFTALCEHSGANRGKKA